MGRWLLVFLFFSLACSSAKREADKKWEERANNVTIIRDQYGIPHIYGRTDADAVFGMMYAQCEENFDKVERSYLRVLGRMSELEGEAYYYQDLSMKILYDTAAAKKDFDNAPSWLKELLYAFSDGIHYYLYKHPHIKPALVRRFEPWYPLLFPDGAYISANTGGLDQTDMEEAFKRNSATSSVPFHSTNQEPAGSNAFAISPARSASGNAMLFINPHVSFYFRTEVHMVSQEGLNAYGAATWGQFFIYQGFNDSLGWMHTSSLADAADLYKENLQQQNGRWHYLYEKEWRPASEKKFSLTYLKKTGSHTDSINVLYTGHGPVIGKRNGSWLSVRAQNHSLDALVQSWRRMKAKNMDEFTEVLSFRTNNSTNTMYADNRGNIAYWHGNFVPKRDPAYNWNLPVDGTIKATEWKGMHEINELVHVINPSSGFVQNCNSSPLHVAGFNSMSGGSYASYMLPEGENFRSMRALSVLTGEQKLSPADIINFSFDGYLMMFDTLLPPLLRAYERMASGDPLKSQLKEPAAVLKSWDRKAAVHSPATTLAVFWAYQLISNFQQQSGNPAEDNIQLAVNAAEQTTDRQKLEALNAVIKGLERIFSDWKIPWGEINRFQRTTASNQDFDDGLASLPVGYASAFFGCLASYETMWGKGNKQYGVAGNSFVALVEFGPRIRASSISTGGQSFDPSSPHFNDQSEMFTKGILKPVNFYRDDVEKNKKTMYRPGQKNK